MNHAEFRKYAHQLVDWMADYQDNVSQYPVKSKIQPGDITRQLPNTAPNTSEEFSKIFDDFQRIILTGVTHWQHPKFFAYYPANTSAPSILADIAKGLRPLWVVAAMGITGSTAIDPLYAIGKICDKYKIWLHVDAAFAGAALILPEMRGFLKSIEYVKHENYPRLL